MIKKDKNNQNINSIPKYQWGNYFKKPIKWLVHQINNYGNSKQPIKTGTSYAYAIADEKKKYPELTEQQIREIVNLRIKQNRKKLGLSTDKTPSQAAAGLALGGFYYPWLAIPDIIFDVAASIDEPSTSNNLHTIADFPEVVAKFTPSKIDDYIAKGVQTLGNIDDAVSTSGRNMFSNFDKESGKINNTTDKTSVRESTNIKYRKKGGILKAESGLAIDPMIIDYIKAIENPDRIGWDGKVWRAPGLKGYDQNQRGYGIDVRTNTAARKLTVGRTGQWLTEDEADTLMRDHIQYIIAAANKHINGFNKLSKQRQIALLGMLYRGDSVNKSNININEPDDNKFFDQVHNYYISKGLKERANSSIKFFKKNNNNNRKPINIYFNFNNYKDLNYPFKFLKEGGKMNILEFLKNGSGIHIKEKNKGKFTSYCGGKVTDECIQKGKNSSNPAIRKRATFAANARKWKHKEGGIIKAQGGTKTNFGQKVSNFLGSELGNTLLNAGTSIVSGIIQNNAINKQIKANNKNMETAKEKTFFDNYQQLKAQKRKNGPTIDDNGNIINHSSIVSDNEAWKEALRTTNTSEIEETYNRVNEELGNQKYMKKNLLLDSIGGVSSAILNNIGKKKNTNTTSSISSNNNAFGNYVGTQIKNYGTFNSDGSMNLGGGLGTFSIKDGYKPQQYQFKIETPKLKNPFT